MKNSMLKYGLVVSLLLNVSLLGTAAYTHYSDSRRAVTIVGPVGTQSRAGPLGPGAPGRCLFEELSLSTQQTHLFQQKASVFHAELNKKREEINKLRVLLLGMMRSDTLDKPTIDATIAQINGKQEEMQKMVVSHMLEFKSMLGKDQQKKFLDMVDRAMTQRREAICP